MSSNSNSNIQQPDQQAQWQPPEPSLAGLPLDPSKTDPTPAYYKLQFGDEETGFSYYVRALSVVIGRNCQRQDPVPPPAIINPTVPTNPPLDPNQPSPPDLFQASILRSPPVADFPSPTAEQSVSAGPASPSILAQNIAEITANGVHSATPESQDYKEGILESVHEENEEGIVEDYGPLVELAEQVHEEDIANLGSGVFHDGDELSAEPELDMKPDLDFDLLPPPPPPPRHKASIDHVDVDLGPLKSVSRNHAKIEYSLDLGRFCLEILGRNGAWIDDRYFVKGSIVPLTQGSQIQIATRIFSFVLPPSSAQSPNYKYYDAPIEDYENLPYPYNLPATEVKYDDFFGEAGPGPASAASIAARQPPAFNAFAAADGYGLGLGVEDNIGWGHWESEHESHGSRSSLSDASSSSLSDEEEPQDELDDEEQELEDGDDEEEEEEEEEEDEELDEEIDDDEDEYEEVKQKTAPVKVKLKKPVYVVPGEDESDLSSVESEPEKPLKKNKKSAPPPKKKTVKPPPAPAKRRGSVTESLETDKGKKSKSGKAKVQAQKEKESKPKNKLKEEIIEVDEPAFSASVPPVDKKSGPTPTKLKSKKTKTEAVEATTTEEKEKPVPKKELKKKSKPVPDTKAASEAKPQSLALPPKPAPLPLKLPPQAPKPAPAPTLAAALALTPTPAPAQAPTPQSTVRPPVPGQSHAVRPPSQPGHPGQILSRPSVQPGVRPTGQPYPPQTPRPGQYHPSHPQYRPPIQAGVRPAQQIQRTTPTPPIPQIQPPFYCTELIETPGRQGHIIVNVPIPPSGAGPRPPPGPILGLDGNPFIGPPPLKPTSTFATIIHKALSCLPRGRGTLGEVCNWVAGEWEWFRLNVDSGWQNSIRHNLSLNKAFLKVPRIPEDDPESKGSVWIIDPQEGPLFEEKQKRDAMKAAGKDKNAESRREKERIRAEERAKKQREAAMEAARNPQVHNTYARAIPPMVRPVVRPPAPALPTPPPPPAQSVTANIKGVLQAKAKITVVMQPITPTMRAKSVIATSDSKGNPLPFVCDGTTLVLDQQTFGHLTSDILDKLTSLGAAGAVDVLSAWVINKNKQQTGKPVPGAKIGPQGPVKNGVTNGVVRPQNGVTSAVRPPGPVQLPKPATSAVPPKPAPSTTTPNANPTPSSSTPAPAKPAPAKNLPGPAPPGTSLTKVIGMIAAVANAKGDVNTVGPNASALLRYIRVVGVDIDLRVAERIWATGVVPPLPVKKVMRPAQTAVGAKPAQGVPGAKPTAPAANAARPPGTPGSMAAAAGAGVKRKLEEGTGSLGGSVGAANGGSNVNGGGTSAGQDAKKPRIETSSA